MKLLPCLALLLMTGLFACIRHEGGKPSLPSSAALDDAAIPAALAEFQFRSLNPDTLLRRLFDTDSFRSNGMAVWKPNYDERNRGLASTNGKAYTTVDTIFYFERQGTRFAAVILASYQFRETPRWENEGCMYCGPNIGVALFGSSDGTGSDHTGWSLYSFKKDVANVGAWGEIRPAGDTSYPISLKWLGDNLPCLSMRTHSGGCCTEFNGIESFYAITPDTAYFSLRRVFSYPTYRTVIDHALSEQPVVDDSTTLLVHKKPAAYYDLTLHTKTLKGQHDTHYRYSEEDGIFEVVR